MDRKLKRKLKFIFFDMGSAGPQGRTHTLLDDLKSMYYGLTISFHVLISFRHRYDN